MSVLGVLLIGAVVWAVVDATDGDPSRSAKDTAEAWVAAINEEDYETACELSVFPLQRECVETLRHRPFGEDLEIEGFQLDPTGEGRFGVSSAGDRKPRGDGWTAYAPREGFKVERVGDGYLVHFEISVIR